jgi:4-hydroxyphenylacetate 3-monooxygenase
MRTGQEYREALRDGRTVLVIGEGVVDDVTTHPATRAMVNEYATWYDHHHDPAWADAVLTPPDTSGQRQPWGSVVPRKPEHLTAMGRCFAATIFPSAGNVTHTPTYGSLISLGVMHAAELKNVSAEQIEAARRYRAMIGETGRFLTFGAGTATIGARLRAEPSERAALKVIREADAGLVVSGRVAMLTSPAFADDVYIGSACGIQHGGYPVSLIVSVKAPGVTVVCRKLSAHHHDPFIGPMSSRFDELDGQLWLDNVLVPWDRAFYNDATPENMAQWLYWHQLYCWLTKAEFTLGLALACAHAMSLTEEPATIDYIVDLIAAAQTVRTCLTAAELDPTPTPQGYCIPGRAHIAVGNIAMQKARQRITEILRILPGSSLVVAPSAAELADERFAAGFEASFGGGGYSALQRAALLSLAWDHVASALDGRESAFELHANGGLAAWRSRLRRDWDRYNELANRVLETLPIEMPRVDVSNIKAMPTTPRRQVTPSRE